MDLAMEFGMPAEQLARVMSEREFGWWAKRARTQWLPSKRIEWYLAQVAHLIAATMGGVTDKEPDDYLLRLIPLTPDHDVKEAQQFFGFAPRRKKKQ